MQLKVGDKQITVNDAMDYRYFLMNNKNYYDELARMSFLVASSVTSRIKETNTSTVLENNDISKFMAKIGMSCNVDYASIDGEKYKFAYGNHEVEYDNVKKNVVLIALSVPQEWALYSKFADIGSSAWATSDQHNANHYKAYETIASEIYNKIITFVIKNKLNTRIDEDKKPSYQDVVYWVSGFGIGGGIANLLSQKLIDNPIINTNINIVVPSNSTNLKFHKYNTVTLETGISNVYAYTFSAPNVVYVNGGNVALSSSKYKSIFNVVEERDILAHLPSTSTGWYKYGVNMSLGKNYHNTQKIIALYNDAFKDRDNLDEKGYKKLYEAWGNDDIFNDDGGFFNMQKEKTYNDVSKENKESIKRFYYKYYDLYNNKNNIETYRRMKTYYDLIPKLKPEHMHMGDGWTKQKSFYLYNGENMGDKIVEAVKIVGEWYIDHVPTYQRKVKFYGDSTSETLKKFRNEKYDEKYYYKFKGPHLIGDKAKKPIYTFRSKHKDDNMKEFIADSFDSSSVSIASGSAVENFVKAAHDENLIYKLGACGFYKLDYDKSDELESISKTIDAGDDCSKFAYVVYDTVVKAHGEKGKEMGLCDYVKITHKQGPDSAGTANFMANDGEFLVESLLQNGFHIYDIGSKNTESPEHIMSFDSPYFVMLQPGDMLCKKQSKKESGHAEFLLKWDNDVPKNINDINKVNITTFGWGRVKDSYSSKFRISYDTKKGFTINNRYSDTNAWVDSYTRVIRYVGIGGKNE